VGDEMPRLKSNQLSIFDAPPVELINSRPFQQGDRVTCPTGEGYIYAVAKDHLVVMVGVVGRFWKAEDLTHV
jgi:hypothetical protein